jgi:HPt (histidine-containing phosphotransfer) domain-containing protein
MMRTAKQKTSAAKQKASTAKQKASTAKQKASTAKHKAVFVATFILTLVAVAGPALAADLPAALVDPYLRVQTALAGDKVDGVKGDAGQIARAAGSLGAQAKAIVDAARQLESAADVTKARDAFGNLSDAIVAYLQASGSTPGSDVKVAFCPMAAKPWLQKGTAIRNPYYGKSMLECGEIKQ